MNRRYWVCGFVLLGAISVNAQDVSTVSFDSSENVVVNRSVPFAELLRQAEAGDKSAQFSVAITYASDSGVLKNYAEAAKWCRKAAENGFAEAQNYMGFLYQRGMGVPLDYGEAVHWFRKAAEQDLPKAKYNLAHMYLYGEGVPQQPRVRQELETVWPWRIFAVLASREIRLRLLAFFVSLLNRGNRPRNTTWE
jgi:TPR repeat protein